MGASAFDSITMCAQIGVCERYSCRILASGNNGLVQSQRNTNFTVVQVFTRCPTYGHMQSATTGITRVFRHPFDIDSTLIRHRFDIDFVSITLSFDCVFGAMNP
jgi:hypothetical protein